MDGMNYIIIMICELKHKKKHWKFEPPNCTWSRLIIDNKLFNELIID